MSPEELREKVRVATINFTGEVSAIFGEAFASVAAEFQTGAAPAHPSPYKAAPQAKVARKPAKAAPRARVIESKVAPKAKAEKRNRRSGNELDKVGGEVIKLLSSSKRSMRVEEINKELGTNTRQLMRPIQKLLGLGKIQKSGERRATSYFV